MGSEMCIRDSAMKDEMRAARHGLSGRIRIAAIPTALAMVPRLTTCLLYTSDAADERSSVDLGGRRIIKKKKDITLRSDLNNCETLK